jgi:hypothetical protein
MYELNTQVNVERLKDMQRDAENERLARSAQNQEKKQCPSQCLESLQAK